MEEQADIVSTATSNVENNITPIITQIQSNASNALNTANTANSTANTAKSIAEGANQALSYTNYEAMITAFNELADNVYKVGQNIMIVTLNVPDLWVSAIENTSITYNYTNDEAITTALTTDGYIQIGYYKLSALETQKVDLTDYYTKTGTENKIEDYLYQIMPTDSASGTIATINDATTMFNAVDVTGNIEPVQDLHGYDNPWPAGGGKNLLNANADTGSSNNVNYIKNGDGTYTVNGTADGTSSFVVGSIELTANTQYVVSGCPSNGSESSYNVRIRDANYTALGFDVGNGATITPTETKTYYYQITVVSGYSVSNLVFKPMICLSTASNPDYAHFAPYSNVCPITGWTGMNVTRTGKNLCMAPLFGLPPSYNDIVMWSTKPTNYTTLAERLNELAPGNYVISCKFTLVTRNDTTDNSTHGIYLLFNDGTSFSNHNLAANKWGTKTVGATDTVSLPITITESTAGTVKDLRFYGCGINGVGTTGSASVSNFQVEKENTGTAYEAYQGTTYPISWQTEAGTVYGGSLDVTTGLLTVDRAKFTASINDTLSGMVRTSYGWVFTISTSSNIYKWQSPSEMAIPTISTINVPTRYNLATVSGFVNIANNPKGKAVFVLADETSGLDANSTQEEITNAYHAIVSMNDTSVVYPLYEPITYQLTPQEVSFLLGTNNLWVNTGDINVTYKADIQKYIDKKTN